MKFPTTLAELKQVVFEIWRATINTLNKRITTVEKQIQQIELDLKLDSNQRYKVFNYTGDNLTQQLIYQDNTLTTLLFTINYTYIGDNLTEIEVIRESNGFTYTKTLSYNINGVLQNIDIT